MLISRRLFLSWVGSVTLIACSPAPSPHLPDAELSCRSEFLTIAQELYRGANPFLGRAKLERLPRRLERDHPPETEARLRQDYAWALLRQGNVDVALEQIERALPLLAASSAARTELRALRALAYLRQAELVNCVQRPNRECCIFPLEGDGLHEVREPAAEARREYEALLAQDPGDLRARWLLNLACMALGDYPEGVPEAWLIPPQAFASEYELGRFANVAASAGAEPFDMCGGVIVEDFDRDGVLDVLTSTFDLEGPMKCYRGSGGMAFEDVSAGARVDDQLGGLNCIGGDYDGDGDVDVFVLRGAWLMDHGRIRNSLLRNDGQGRFYDVTRSAGVAEPAAPTQAACFGDFDGDGDLDLYVVNESRREIGPPGGDFPAQLFVNRGDGTFADEAAARGVSNDRYAKGVAAGDYDNDGDLDLYVSNVGPNRLYENQGQGTFIDVAPRLEVSEPAGRSFATWFFDYDNDGWLDLFVAGYDSTLADVAAGYLGLPHDGEPPRLYRNEGGRFRDVTLEAGLSRPLLPMGANFGDLDGDGWLDLYLATGEPSYEALVPNVALRNDGGRRFQDVTWSSGLGHLQKGHGVAFADLDGDGDQDIYNQLGGFYPGDAFRNALFENPGHGNAFLHVTLIGTRSNKSAIGARLCVRVAEGGSERELHRAVGSVSSFGGSPLRQEIGLGRTQRILALEVRWPRSAQVQTVEGVEPDTWIEIREGRPGFRVRALR